MSLSNPPLEAAKKRSASRAAWLGLLPFFLFGLAFEFLPLLTVIQSSLTSRGILTLDFYRQALDPLFLRSFGNSIKLSATTAGLGVIFGTLVAYGIITTPNRFLQNALTALSD